MDFFVLTRAVKTMLSFDWLDHHIQKQLFLLLNLSDYNADTYVNYVMLLCLELANTSIHTVTDRQSSIFANTKTTNFKRHATKSIDLRRHAIKWYYIWQIHAGILSALTYNGHVLQSGGRYVVQGSYNLNINQVQISDEGEYQCVLGTLSSAPTYSCYLAVIGTYGG